MLERGDPPSDLYDNTRAAYQSLVDSIREEPPPNPTRGMYPISVGSVNKQGVGDVSFDTSHLVSVGNFFDPGSLYCSVFKGPPFQPRWGAPNQGFSSSMTPHTYAPAPIIQGSL